MGRPCPHGAGLRQAAGGLETERTVALVGAAGYLISPIEPYHARCRALGAALIAVVVEDSLADTLSQAARHVQPTGGSMYFQAA